MKTKIIFTCTLGFTLLAMAASHVWTFKNGKTFEGDYVSSGTTAVVVKHDGTNCFLKITSLATNDSLYIVEMQFAQRQARLDAELKQMRQIGMVELSAKLIEHFPEQVLPYKKAWIDAEFESLSQIQVEAPEIEVGLKLTDKNGEAFYSATIFKQLTPPSETPAIPNPLAKTVLNFKSGDKVRLIGHCYPKFSDHLHKIAETPDRAGFLVEQIELIESSAEKMAKKIQAADNP